MAFKKTRNMKVYGMSGYHYRSTPTIQLKGEWLKEIGFDILDESKSVGFGYAKQLFECAIFCYYDRFRNFDPQVVKKLFTWAFMIRVDMENLPFDTINRYALGINDNSNYSNSIPMFSIINNARIHTEVASVPVTVLRTPDEARNKKNWNELYLALKRINGFEEVK